MYIIYITHLSTCYLVGGFNPSILLFLLGLNFPNIWKVIKHVPNLQHVFSSSFLDGVSAPNHPSPATAPGPSKGPTGSKAGR